MRFEYPSQRLQDWLSQRWVMLRGQQVDPAQIEWLMGPFGNVDVIGDQYVERLASAEDLLVERDTTSSGLLESITDLNLPPAE